MGIVKADKPNPFVSMQCQRVFDPMRLILGWRHTLYAKSCPMLSCSVNHKSLPIQIQKCV